MTHRSLPSKLKSIALIACAMLLCLCANPARSQNVLLVLSSEAAPYVTAANACHNRLASEDINSEIVLFSDLDDHTDLNSIKVIITFGARASATIARKLPAEAMLFYCMTPNPEKYGLTSRINTSGLSSDTSLLDQLDFIQQVQANVNKIGVLYRSNKESSVKILENLQSVVPADLQLIAVDLDKETTDSESIKELLAQNVDVVWTVPDTAVYNSAIIKALLLESLRRNTPVFGFSHALVKAGATFGIGIDPKEQGSSLAGLVIENAIDIHILATPMMAINEIAADRIGLEFTSKTQQDVDVVFGNE